MPKEFDLAGLDSISGWLRLKKKRANIPVGAPCENCTTTLKGAFCHECGQFAIEYHRSIIKICGEILEGMLHFDSRFWHTLPGLLFTPGRLTRAYLQGKRAIQIPPFRLFLFVLLVTFFVGHYVYVARSQDPLGFLKNIKTDGNELPLAGPISQELAAESLKGESIEPMGEWLKTRTDKIRKDPERFLLVLEIWAYRVAVLALPLMAMMLTMLFIFNRRFYIYDHLVFSVHSITFHLLLLTSILLLTIVIGSAAWWLAFAGPVHLWFHLRGVYSTGIFGTLIRQFILGLGTFIGIALLALLWIFVGVNAMS